MIWSSFFDNSKDRCSAGFPRLTGCRAEILASEIRAIPRNASAVAGVNSGSLLGWPRSIIELVCMILPVNWLLAINSCSAAAGMVPCHQDASLLWLDQITPQESLLPITNAVQLVVLKMRASNSLRFP